MFINRKISATVAALSLALMSFVSMSVAYADEPTPTLTVDAVTTPTVNEYMDGGVSFSLSNIPEGVHIDSIAYNISIPGDMLEGEKVVGRNFVRVPMTSIENMETALGGVSNKGFFASSTNLNQHVQTLYDPTTGIYKIFYFWVTPAGTNAFLEPSDKMEFDYYFADGKTAADLPVGSFHVENVSITYKNDNVAKSVTVVNNAEVKETSGDTTVEVGTITGTTEDDVKDYDGFKATTNIGGYTGETEADKATAFTAAISGTSASGNLVWKVTSDGTTKYRKQSIGGNFSGEANVGLVVSGMQDTAATAEVAFWN